MRRRLGWKLALILGVSIGSIAGLFPVEERLRLGLDLKGGIHLVLRVHSDDAVGYELDEEAGRLRARLQDERIPFSAVERSPDGWIQISGVPDTHGQALDDEVLRGTEDYLERRAADGAVRLKFNEAYERRIREQAVQASLETIRNRVDEFGVSEPVIQRHGLGGENILVQLPGLDDPERAKRLIRQTAVLELKLVVGGPAPREALLQPYGGQLPTDMQLLADDERRAGPDAAAQFYLVQRAAVVTGTDLKIARRGQDQNGLPAVHFSLNATGASKFSRATRENIGKQLAIVLDGKVKSAPSIRSEIKDSGIIEGRFTEQEAEDLALVLRSGALPARLEVAEQRSVGPSLGHDSIQQGIRAAIVGVALVMIFMVFYYRLSGFNAILALVLNSAMLFGMMGWLGAVLTLPGIAGFVLSIGMAVDANVLIFERIREELRSGKAVRSAVQLGFERAFSAIFDGNLTTLIAAAFLFQFGTGPIKGFAVTLFLGLLASMFTAIYVSRWMFEVYLLGRQSKHLSIGSLRSFNFQIDFLRYRTIAITVSLIVILACAVAYWRRGGFNFGVDFAGGSEIQVHFDAPQNSENLRQALQTQGLGNVAIQQFGNPRDFLIRVDQSVSGARAGELIHQALAKPVPPGKRDLNNLGVDELTAWLRQSDPLGLRGAPGGVLSYRQAAQAIGAARTENGGLLKNFGALRKLSEVGPELTEFLRRETVLGSFAVVRNEYVGPAVGADLRERGLLALIFANLGILAYASFRFKFRYGLGAVVALLHDALITSGLFALTGREVNLTVLAAILTIIGFSVNDTIVIFDRVRENLRSVRRRSLAEVINLSINQTLGRTILTSLTVFFVVLALFFYGGEVINNFAFGMLVGVISGTYSTVFIAAPVVLAWEAMVSKRRKRYAAAA